MFIRQTHVEQERDIFHTHTYVSGSAKCKTTPIHHKKKTKKKSNDKVS